MVLELSEMRQDNNHKYKWNETEREGERGVERGVRG